MEGLPGAAAATTAPAYGRISVSGSNFLVDGVVSDEHFFGVVDTTALQFAILAYVDGQTQYAGKTSVFDGPDTSNQGSIAQNANPAVFWDQYFALLQHYDCNLVRIGAADSWGTDIQYQAWTAHQAAFVSLLDTMLAAAQAHGVYVVLVLAGSQDYPAYQFGGFGSVFVPGSSAYDNYIAFSRGVMSALDGQTALAWYDVFNEPDHDKVWANYWSSNGGKDAFHTWADDVATATAGASTHPRTMGSAALGAMFGWNKGDFDLATGTVPFEIAQVHYYGSNSDPNNFALPQQWAKADDKPLLWGELGYNAVYPLVRYTFGEQAIWSNGGQAITSMVLTGTSGYPYTGGAITGTTTAPASSIASAAPVAVNVTAGIGAGQANQIGSTNVSSDLVPGQGDLSSGAPTTAVTNTSAAPAPTMANRTLGNASGPTPGSGTNTSVGGSTTAENSTAATGSDVSPATGTGSRTFVHIQDHGTAWWHGGHHRLDCRHFHSRGPIHAMSMFWV